MKIRHANFGYLKWSMAFLVLVVITVGVSGIALYRLIESAQQQYRDAQATYLESRTKLARAAQEEAELRAMGARFLELQAQGHVGRENRLEWIEQLARLRNEYRLSDFQYEFMPQKIIDPLLIPDAAVAQFDGYRFLMTPQRLSVNVLHEGDLFAFLDKLHRSVKARVIVHSCHMERLPPPAHAKAKANPAAPLLSATCELHWVTLQGQS